MKHTSILLTVLALTLGTLSAQVPNLISYQGYVTDTSGNPLGNPTSVNRTVTFRIWNSPTATAAGNRLYSETQTVTIANGDFSVLVGAGTLADGSAALSTVSLPTECYLGVTVDDGNSGTADPEISPRQRMVSTAFTFRAKVAETVANGAVTTAMLANNAIDATKIANTTITNTQISTSAAITDNKLAQISTAGKVANSATTATSANTANAIIARDSSGNFSAGIMTGIATSANTLTTLLPVSLGGTGSATQNFVDLSTTQNVAGSKTFTADLSMSNTKLLFPGTGTGLLANPTNGVNGSAGTRIVLYPGTGSETPFGIGMASSTLWYGAASNATHRWFTGTTERMSLSNAGHLAVTSTLGVNGGVLVNSTNRLIVQGDDAGTLEGAQQLMIRGSTTTTKRLLLGVDTTNNRGSIQAVNSGSVYLPLALNPNGGSVGIGIAAPSGVLDINVQNNTADHWDVRFVGVAGTGAIRMTDNGFLDITNVAGSGANHSGLARLNNTGSWSAVSDRRLKHEIEPLGGLLEKALALKPVSYRFKTQTNQERHLGFIAQEVQKLLPSFVNEGETLTLNYAGLSTVAIGAIQEQHQIVKEQQEDIAKLAASNAALEERVKKLEARDKARDAKLAAFEKLLNAMDKPAARTASLK